MAVLAVPSPCVHESASCFGNSIGGRHAHGLSVTGQQHIGVESGKGIEGSHCLGWIVTEDGWHQPRPGAIGEEIAVHEGIAGYDDSVIG